MILSIPVSTSPPSEIPKFRNRSDAAFGANDRAGAQARVGAQPRLTNKPLWLWAPAFAGATFVGSFAAKKRLDSIYPTG
jgi:hypothetical protein